MHIYVEAWLRSNCLVQSDEFQEDELIYADLEETFAAAEVCGP